MSLTSASMRFVRLAPSTTFAPLPARRRAVLSPMPLLAPVITTTLSALSFSLSPANSDWLCIDYLWANAGCGTSYSGKKHPSNRRIASDAFVGCDSQGCHRHLSVLPLSLRPCAVSHCSRHFQVVVALFAREPADSRRESVAAPSTGCRFAKSIGMATHISVPAPFLLQLPNRAPIFSARSRIPRRPQCESHSLGTASGLIPQPLSRTITRRMTRRH